MPGNEVEDRIHNFFERDNSSQGQHQSQAEGGSWPVLNYNQWLGNHRQIPPLSFNLKNYNVQQLDYVRRHGSESLRVPFDQNYTQLTLRPEYSRSHSGNQQLNSNGFMHGNHIFQTRQNPAELSGKKSGSDRHNLTLRGLSILESQQGNASGRSPTLKTNSEGLETAEAHSDLNFLGGQQHLVRGQEPGMPQPRPRQQSGFNDMQFLRQQIMFKQLQELQRQQQLKQLGDARQQNSINQLSAITKQAAGGQFPPLINGTPIHDASQMFMNWEPRGASPAVQGVANGLVSSQEQGQALHSMGLVPQQLDVSIYGTPIGGARGNLSQYSNLQGIAHDHTNLLNKASGTQAQKPIMQSTALNNSSLGDQCTVSSDQVCMPDGAFISKQGIQGKNLFGQVPIQGLNSVVPSENFQQVNTLQRSASMQELNGRQDRAGWPGLSQIKTTQIGHSQGLVTLDPIEEKILFNMDDNIWDSSFGRRTHMGTGSFGNTSEHTDYLNALPSIQSGSWSALMQSAVAEASSSDTGLQEEWSGLTFQNTELSTDNQPSNFMDSGKQQPGWVDNNLQSASSSSKPLPMFINDSNMSPSFPGFHQSGIQFPFEQREGLRRESSHESIQQSPKNAGKWLDRSPQQKPAIEGIQEVQPLMHLENEWAGQTYEHSESDVHQQSISSYNNGSQQCNRPKDRNIESLSPGGNATLNIRANEKSADNCWRGDIDGVTNKQRDPDGRLWKTDDNHGASSFSNSTGGLEQIQSGTDNTLVDRVDSRMNNFAAVPNSSTTKVDQETRQQVQDSHRHDYMKHVDISVKHKGNGNMGKDQHQPSNGPQVLDNSYKGAGEACEKQQNFYQRENSNDSYNSNASQHIITGREMKQNVWLNASDSQPVAKGDQRSSSGQVLGQQVSQGLTGREQGYFGQFKWIGNVSNSAMDLEKGHFPDFQGNSKASADVPSRGNLGPSISSSFDRSVGFYGPNIASHRSQNMLELLHKVDQSREDSTVTHFGSTECNPLSKVPEAETPDASDTQLYNQSSASQGFGLRLAPPSQGLPSSNLFFSPQSSPQTAINLNSRHVNPEMGEKGQTWLAPPSSGQSLPPSHELSRRDCWDDKSSISGQTSIETSHLNLQGNSPAAFTSGPPYLRNQLQWQQMSNAPVACQSSQAMFPGTAGRLPPFNLAPSQDTSRLICTNPFGQQFPVLGAVPVTQPSVMSGMYQEGGFSRRPHNVWTNVPTQRHLSGAEPHKVLSRDPSNNSLEATSWAPQELNDQNSGKCGNGSSEFGACSMNSQGCDYGEEQPGKETSQQQISSEILSPASQTGGLSQGQESVEKHLSDANAIASGSVVACSHQQDFDRVRHGNNQPTAAFVRDLEAFGRSLKPSHVLHQNDSPLHQVLAMKNAGTDPSKRVLTRYSGADCDLDGQQVNATVGQKSLYGHNTRFRNPMHNELNPESRLNSFPSGDTKMLSFLSEARENWNVKAPSQPDLQDIPSQETVAFGRNDNQSHSSSSNLESNRTEHSQISLQMANSWFKHYGTLKNGQMLPMYDARIAKTAAEQLSLGKPSENMHKHTSMERINAPGASQIGSVWPSTAATFIRSEHLSTPYVLPSEVTDQSLAVIRPKKRKIAASELLPWHKEVTQGSQRIQSISMAELDWAQATNRMIEKVEDEAEMIVDGQPMLRPKTRLILTTQLMQQLLRPAPAAILSADAASDYDSVAHFVAKLALGDACSLTSCTRSDSCVPGDNINKISEKLNTSERIGDQYFLKVVENFTGRVKQLENDLLRLDKSASILDTKVECQELERFSVINRFAKFHTRGQADAAETSSSSGTAASALKSFPQRYVTALPMPRKLPEGTQCLSL